MTVLTSCYGRQAYGIGKARPFISTHHTAGYVMQDLRSMVAHLSGTDLAVAGHAVALAGWHQVLRTCSMPFLQRLDPLL